MIPNIRKASIRKGNQRRKLGRPHRGAAAIITIMVIGGIAIALLTLSSRTAIQMRAQSRIALDAQQSAELIALGEMTLRSRLVEDAAYRGETISVQLPWFGPDLVEMKSVLGEIAIEPWNGKLPESGERWRIAVHFGYEGGVPYGAAKEVDLSQ